MQQGFGVFYCCTETKSDIFHERLLLTILTCQRILILANDKFLAQFLQYGPDASFLVDQKTESDFLTGQEDQKSLFDEKKKFLTHFWHYGKDAFFLSWPENRK